MWIIPCWRQPRFSSFSYAFAIILLLSLMYKVACTQTWKTMFYYFAQNSHIIIIWPKKALCTKSFVEKLKKSPLVLFHASNFLMRSVIHQCFLRSLQEVIFVKNSWTEKNKTSSLLLKTTGWIEEVSPLGAYKTLSNLNGNEMVLFTALESSNFFSYHLMSFPWLCNHFIAVLYCALISN